LVDYVVAYGKENEESTLKYVHQHISDVIVPQLIEQSQSFERDNMQVSLQILEYHWIGDGVFQHFMKNMLAPNSNWADNHFAIANAPPYFVEYNATTQLQKFKLDINTMHIMGNIF